jgi:hypothetical protein
MDALHVPAPQQPQPQQLLQPQQITQFLRTQQQAAAASSLAVGPPSTGAQQRQQQGQVQQQQGQAQVTVKQSTSQQLPYPQGPGISRQSLALSDSAPQALQPQARQLGVPQSSVEEGQQYGSSTGAQLYRTSAGVLGGSPTLQDQQQQQQALMSSSSPATSAAPPAAGSSFQGQLRQQPVHILQPGTVAVPAVGSGSVALRPGAGGGVIYEAVPMGAPGQAVPVIVAPQLQGFPAGAALHHAHHHHQGYGVEEDVMYPAAEASNEEVGRWA